MVWCTCLCSWSDAAGLEQWVKNFCISWMSLKKSLLYPGMKDCLQHGVNLSLWQARWLVASAAAQCLGCGGAEQKPVGLRLLPWLSLTVLVPDLPFPFLGSIWGGVFWAEGAETAGASAQRAGRVWSCQATVLGWAASPFWGNLGWFRVPLLSTWEATAPRRRQRDVAGLTRRCKAFFVLMWLKRGLIPSLSHEISLYLQSFKLSSIASKK